MTEPMMDALKECIKELDKIINKLNNDRQGLISADKIAVGMVSVNYDGIEYRTLDDINEAYGVGAITSTRMLKLIEELHKKQASVSLEYKIDKLEHKIKYYSDFRKNLYNTLHWDD